MSSVKSVSTPLLLRDKRPRPDDPHDSLCEVLPKRACPDLPISESVSSHLCFLEDFCELENHLDPNVVESATQEDLVSEMMRSLEKVIGAIEDPSQSQSFISGSASLPLLACQSVAADVQDLPTVSIKPSDTTLEACHSCELDVNEFSSADSGRDFLLETSEENPGVSAYAQLELEFSEIAGAESPLIESFSNYIFDASMLQGTAGIFPIVQGDWIDASFGEVEEESGLDYARDYCDVISSDYCL